MFKFASINLGCNKNMVDLEFILGKILSETNPEEIEFHEDPESIEVEFIIINTCGFLSSAREEAEKTIKYYDDLGKKTIIIGCYLKVADNKFLESLKNLYRIIPFENTPNSKKEIIDEKINKFKNQKLEDFLFKISKNQDKKQAHIWDSNNVRAYLNSPYGYEYLKIAEGCDNNCTFCIIPKIRGRQISRSIEDIVNEAKIMINNGIKEIILIAQDTTRYGVDLYSEPRLIELLEKLEKIPGDFKYRILYMYPDNLSLKHLEKLKTFKKFIPYFDIPFQHISEKILKLMGRYYDQKSIFEFLDYIKTNFPTHHLRTSFIIGFPTEDEKDFEELINFIKKYEFDSVGLFEYHDEPLSASVNIKPKVDSKTISSRIVKLDKIINDIYDKKFIKDTGKKFSGYIYDYDEESIYIRRELKAPEIDDLDVIDIKKVPKKELNIGNFVEYIV